MTMFRPRDKVMRLVAVSHDPFGSPFGSLIIREIRQIAEMAGMMLQAETHIGIWDSRPDLRFPLKGPFVAEKVRIGPFHEQG